MCNEKFALFFKIAVYWHDSCWYEHLYDYRSFYYFFAIFREFSLRKLQKIKTNFRLLPRRHQQMLPNFKDHIKKVEKCIEENQSFLFNIVSHTNEMFENRDHSRVSSVRFIKYTMQCPVYAVRQFFFSGFFSGWEWGLGKGVWGMGYQIFVYVSHVFTPPFPSFYSSFPELISPFPCHPSSFHSSLLSFPFPQLSIPYIGALLLDIL